MDGQLFEMMYRERQVELERVLGERRRASAARDRAAGDRTAGARAALPVASRRARRALRALDAPHRAA